jgi:hypothetical protein
MSAMKNIMHFLFLSCLKASEMIEKKLHFRLSFRERMQLKMHKMMCSACSNFEKHNLFVEKAISNFESNSGCRFKALADNEEKAFEERIIEHLPN